MSPSGAQAASSPGSRHPSLWVRELPFGLVLILTTLGVAYTSFSKQPIIAYWEVLAPIIGIVCIGAGWQNAKDRAAQFASVPTRMKPATVSTSGVLSYRRRRLRAGLPERVFHCKCLDLHAGIEDAPSRRIWSRATVT